MRTAEDAPGAEGWLLVFTSEAVFKPEMLEGAEGAEVLLVGLDRALFLVATGSEEEEDDLERALEASTA